MKAEKLLTRLEAEHRKALRQLDRFHRYTAGTATSNKAWDAYCKACDEFNTALAELRAAGVALPDGGKTE